MYETMQGHCAVCLLETLNGCNFVLIGERFREASETECRHKLEVILAFCAFGENPQFSIQHHPINITQLSAGKLQVSADRKAVTIKVWRWNSDHRLLLLNRSQPAALYFIPCGLAVSLI